MHFFSHTLTLINTLLDLVHKRSSHPRIVNDRQEQIAFIKLFVRSLSNTCVLVPIVASWLFRPFVHASSTYINPTYPFTHIHICCFDGDDTQSNFIAVYCCWLYRSTQIQPTNSMRNNPHSSRTLLYGIKAQSQTGGAAPIAEGTRTN